MTGAARDQVLWQRLDVPGLEWCEIRRGSDGINVEGIALVANEGTPHRIEYAIELDALGRTRRTVVRPTPPNERIDFEVDQDGHWLVNGVAAPALTGCLDVDLGFSPMTNSLPIWRLQLPPGETKAIRAVWLRFPELTVELLHQSYERTAASTYLYRSGGFEAFLRVDAEGIVEEYESFWRAVARRRLTSDA